jgi:hypothetical protein
MSRVVFLLEEPSMKVLLDGLLPRLFPGLPFWCIAHEGKSDLELSIPRKLRAWREPGVRFVVIRDNDGGDCRGLKAALRGLCDAGGRDDVLVRIACQELEAWYLGEPDALAEAFDMEKLRALAGRAKFRDPDAVQKPSVVIGRLIPSFQKVSGARRLARYLTRERNRSTSFQALIEGLEPLAAALAAGGEGRVSCVGRVSEA